MYIVTCDYSWRHIQISRTGGPSVRSVRLSRPISRRRDYEAIYIHPCLLLETWSFQSEDVTICWNLKSISKAIFAELVFMFESWREAYTFFVIRKSHNIVLLYKTAFYFSSVSDFITMYLKETNFLDIILLILLRWYSSKKHNSFLSIVISSIY